MNTTETISIGKFKVFVVVWLTMVISLCVGVWAGQVEAMGDFVRQCHRTGGYYDTSIILKNPVDLVCTVRE